MYVILWILWCSVALVQFVFSFVIGSFKVNFLLGTSTIPKIHTLSASDIFLPASCRKGLFLWMPGNDEKCSNFACENLNSFPLVRWCILLRHCWISLLYIGLHASSSPTNHLHKVNSWIAGYWTLHLLNILYLPQKVFCRLGSEV